MRSRYTREALSEADVDADPVVQFGRWFEQAEQAGLLEPTAMTLATATPDGRPSARMVLLRGFDERGFCFYTNYESRKAAELAANRPQPPWSSGGARWSARSASRAGSAPTSRPESETYFHSRPRQSAQRGRLPEQGDRRPRHLERRVAELATATPTASSPSPTSGAATVSPTTPSSSGRASPSRLHDRLRYQRAGDWKIERLAPDTMGRAGRPVSDGGLADGIPTTALRSMVSRQVPGVLSDGALGLVAAELQREWGRPGGRCWRAGGAAGRRSTPRAAPTSWRRRRQCGRTAGRAGGLASRRVEITGPADHQM